LQGLPKQRLVLKRKTAKGGMDEGRENGQRDAGAAAAANGELPEGPPQDAREQSTGGETDTERRAALKAAAELLASEAAQDLLGEEERKRLKETWGAKKEEDKKREKAERERLRRAEQKRKRADLEAKIESFMAEKAAEDSEDEVVITGGAAAGGSGAKRPRGPAAHGESDDDGEGDKDEDMIIPQITAGERRKRHERRVKKTGGWKVNLYAPAPKVEQDGTCILPTDTTTAGALARGPNTEGEHKVQRKWELVSVKGVTKEMAAQITRERDGLSENADEKECVRAQSTAEAAATFVRYMDGCSEFPDLQQAALEAGGQALDATRVGAPTPPHATDLIFPLLALAFKRLSQLRDRAAHTEHRMSSVEAKILRMGQPAPQYVTQAHLQLASAGKQQQRKDGGAAAAASSGGPSVCGICAAKNRYEVKVLGKQAADPASMKHAQADCPNQGLPDCEGFKMIDQLFRASSKKQ